ncbi:MAG: hypothetical protein ABII12_14425 [Planctomycetota bacterium]
MDTEQPQPERQPVALPVHPPTVPPPMTASAANRGGGWATAIGIIAIILGALNILQGCSGAVSPLLMGGFARMAPVGQPTGMEGMLTWQAWTIPLSILGLCLGILLLVVGIGILKRRRWAVRAGFYWAMLKVPFALASSILGYLVQQDTFEAIQQQGGAAMPPMGGGFFAAMGAFTVVFGLVWGWALPVFLIVWLSRQRIKAEVACWS